MKNIYAIVAMTKKTNAIGNNGKMLYHLKYDLKYFKDMTVNNTIVCGRKTYYSFPKRPLPNRKNLVLTRNDMEFDGAVTLHSKEDIIKYAEENPNEKIFICGGDNIYSQFMDIVSRLYITEIEENEEIDADSFFPEIDPNIWSLKSESEPIIEENTPQYKFLVYDKK